MVAATVGVQSICPCHSFSTQKVELTYKTRNNLDIVAESVFLGGLPIELGC